MKLEDAIFEIKDQDSFQSLSLEVFRFQYERNRVYRSFVDSLKKDIRDIQNIDEIPFLPIGFFKTHKVSCQENFQKVFLSSATTSMVQSKHYVFDLNLYQRSFLNTFQNHFGELSELCIFALLPSYLEREGSSLVYMVEKLIEKSHPKSGFYLHNQEELAQKILENEKNQLPTLLFGVSYALLDFAQRFPMSLSNTKIMDTGGMKGKREEMPKEEFNAVLKKAFGLSTIYSEYGMTELLSQGYTTQESLFETPSWMKILIRELNDPFCYLKDGQTGGINVIDLANLYSCSFIATDDLGKNKSSCTFEVLGRFDHSDLRGCNLLVQ
ncbi:MAG: acyl transferase [Flavobacteriaceae bacterium]|nr:MAG: acyl transferase [Flavobacteriaceae bacterium]